MEEGHNQCPGVGNFLLHVCYIYLAYNWIQSFCCAAGAPTWESRCIFNANLKRKIDAVTCGQTPSKVVFPVNSVKSGENSFFSFCSELMSHSRNCCRSIFIKWKWVVPPRPLQWQILKWQQRKEFPPTPRPTQLPQEHTPSFSLYPSLIKSPKKALSKKGKNVLS